MRSSDTIGQAITDRVNKEKTMHEELAKLINAERKNKRELKELRDLRHTIHNHKAPDQKTLAMIDAEIKKYLGEK